MTPDKVKELAAEAGIDIIAGFLDGTEAQLYRFAELLALALLFEHRNGTDDE